MDDEAQIRALVQTWMQASKAGDMATVLDLMTDDAVFLLPGRAPMHKSDFAAAANAQRESAARGSAAPEGHSEIQEIQILGDWAFLRTYLSVRTPAHGETPAQERRGHTLSVLHRERGTWRLARDANLLAPTPAVDDTSKTK